MCSGLKNSTDEKYSEAFFDSITSSEYTLNFSSSDFAETTSEKGDVVIVECNGLSYELTSTPVPLAICNTPDIFKQIFLPNN